MVLILPLMLVVGLLILIVDGWPPFYRQARPGLHGRIFTLWKFRTMRNLTDAEGKAAPDSSRISPLGRILRSSSLDELPEFFHVLGGKMSLVGPRPLLVQYLERYTPDQARRHEVLPGITGWAQVNGRNALTWEDKFKLDVWYVDNWSLRLDVRILWMTVMKTLRREGINAPGEATAREFLGSPQTETNRERDGV